MVASSNPEQVSLRDYFAGQALQGLLASCTTDEAAFGDPNEEGMEYSMAQQYRFGAQLAYGYADSMLKAREVKR